MIYPRNHKINVLRFACMAVLVDGGPRKTVDAFLTQISEFESARLVKPAGRNWPARTIITEFERRGLSFWDLEHDGSISVMELRRARTRDYIFQGITPAHHVIAAALGETVERVFPETCAITPRKARRAA